MGWSVVGAIVNLILTVIVSFYMLIDGRRIFILYAVLPRGSRTRRRGPTSTVSRLPSADSCAGRHYLARPLDWCAALAIWILSWEVVGVWPEGGQYALLFGFLGWGDRVHPLCRSVAWGHPP